MPKKYEAPYFSGALPAVGLYDEAGKLVMYVHKQSELDKWTKPKDEGGPGLTTEQKFNEWPKVMSSPGRRDVLVANLAEQHKREAEGYSFDHWTNKMAMAQLPEGAMPSFDPKSQARMDDLERRNRELSEKINDVLATLVEKTAEIKARKKPGRKPKATFISEPTGE